ncbi:uncharacterized protein [Littorina saxatilis]|uniref:Uncharacterized protein n=1 Tax=Littorina saxatilis TaxID=31220 RepID=A0AAN9G4F8_9CAEN
MVCWRFFARNPMMPRQNDAFHHNGNAVWPQPEAQPIQTGNKNVALLCFRNDDGEIVNRWGDEILQSCNSKPRKRVHVIESLDDVTAIPPCRAALVFVDPDEMEMIIEDERHHIGMSLRRQAVQRLLDSRVEVFIVVYHDKNTNDLTSGQMYNRKLGQIDQHAQLKQLKGQTRVFSMKDSLKPWQTGQIVGEMDAIFS